MFESQPNYLKGVLWWKYCNQTCPFVCNIKMNLFAAEDRPCKIGISLEMIFSSQALEVLSDSCIDMQEPGWLLLHEYDVW